MQEAFARYGAYFLNKEIQVNIHNAKEEQFQEGFLRELFVKVLGYTINPEPNFNLTTELKNIKDSKKTDGAIVTRGSNPLSEPRALAVIELKGTETKDLDKVNVQAFNYKNNHPDCVYVITSNYEKLRFYIHNAVEHEEFNLFTLSEERFALLWLYLQKDNLLGGIPAKVKEESLLAEEKITKALYADYSAFKQALWENMVEGNGQHDQLLLYKKSQKLLDRFLFILFAEDKGLLPPNSISRIVERWELLKDEDAYKPLYDIFRQYFGYMDTGRKGKLPADDISAYNGGLFKLDEVLDGLVLSDELLRKHCMKLSGYNYESEVDTNILGHIFEHSLNDIENVRAQLEGTELDKSKTKRKKDGVFYTPKYITKYIVDNTVGKLCAEKKLELGIEDEEFAKGSRNRKKEIIKELNDKLEGYREWLLQLTICDPACGSGAFLNQALDFLIREHAYVSELSAQLLARKDSYTTQTAFSTTNVEAHILEHNIYGVDINEESVEIARLSLWLRTAQKGRKLSSLSSNIKCGNSLINDPQVAGDLAFDWKKEFVQVFEKGGFDAVIGNPPYVHLEAIKDVSLQLSKVGFKTFDKRGDLYPLFVEHGFNILKTKGAISYIMPNKWLQAGYGKSLREYFLEKQLTQLIDFGDIQIFQGATTYPCIFIARNDRPQLRFSVSVLKATAIFDFYSNVIETAETFRTDQFNGDTWVISSNTNHAILESLNSKFQNLSESINGAANYGIKPGLTEAFIIDEATRNKIVSEDPNAASLIEPVLRGRDIIPWHGVHQGAFMICTFPALNIDIEKYPSIKAHFLSIGKHRLEQTGNEGSRKKTSNKWFETQDPISYHLDFKRPKIMYQKFQVKPCFVFDEHGYYCNDSMWIIPTERKALVGVLNSKMGWWLITKYCTQIQNGCQLIWKYFGQIPVPNLDNTSKLEASSDMRLQLTASFQQVSKNFVSLLQSKVLLENPSTKLEQWPSLDFKGFLGELGKAKVKLTLGQEAEWMAYFNEQKAKANGLQAEIARIDREIDQMVYGLYGLTEEEVRIVEGR